MATIRVLRRSRDRFGDLTAPVPVLTIPGARIAWAQATVDTDRRAVVSTRPTVYIKRLAPDIRTGDVIEVFGRKLKVIETQLWEHPRREGVIVGTAVICEEVR
jgi:hypothetical protein